MSLELHKPALYFGIAHCQDWSSHQWQSTATAFLEESFLNTFQASPQFASLYTWLQVLLGGGQDAADVTITVAKAGGFEARFFHKVRRSIAVTLKSI